MSGVKARIICVGSRFAPGDDSGPRVHDLLARGRLPAGVELIDGGLRGLDLLGCADGAERLVFVDCVRGFGGPGEVRVLEGSELGGLDAAFGHDGGLAYLLRVLPALCGGRAPELKLVGVEGPADAGAIERAALASVAAATGGQAGPREGL